MNTLLMAIGVGLLFVGFIAIPVGGTSNVTTSTYLECDPSKQVCSVTSTTTRYTSTTYNNPTFISAILTTSNDSSCFSATGPYPSFCNVIAFNGVRITIDGTYAGVTPLTKFLSCGTHTITLGDAGGYSPVRTVFNNVQGCQTNYITGVYNCKDVVACYSNRPYSDISIDSLGFPIGYIIMALGAVFFGVGIFAPPIQVKKK